MRNNWIPYPDNEPSSSWFYWVHIKGVKTNKGVTASCWDSQSKEWLTPDGMLIEAPVTHYMMIDLESIMPEKEP